MFSFRLQFKKLFLFLLGVVRSSSLVLDELEDSETRKRRRQFGKRNTTASAVLNTVKESYFHFWHQVLFLCKRGIRNTFLAVSSGNTQGTVVGLTEMESPNPVSARNRRKTCSNFP